MSVVPLYWMNEITGNLALSVKRYLSGAELTQSDVTMLCAYLTEWIEAPCWNDGEEVNGLRDLVGSLTTRQQIDLWVERAQRIGLDPW